MTNSLQGKVALITGAANGIGAAVAKRMAQQGAELILVDKDSKALELLDDVIQSLGGKATLVPLDLRQLHKIDELVVSVADRFKRLDILVGNAAILGELGPITDLKPDRWQEVMDVNLTANWRLLKGFDPMLKKASAGRAIFLTSSVAKTISPYWSAYAVSKAGLEMMVGLYAKEIVKTHPQLHVELFDPGLVRTDLRAVAMPGEDPSLLIEPDTVSAQILNLAA